MLGDKTSIKNPSTATGKSIHDYSPRSLENVTLPRNKSKRRKVQKTANKYGMTVEQVLVLSDPFLWPVGQLLILIKIGKAISSAKFHRDRFLICDQIVN